MGTPLPPLPPPAATDLALLGVTRSVASPVALNSGVKMMPPPSSDATVPLPAVSWAATSGMGAPPVPPEISGASTSGGRRSAVFFGVVKLPEVGPGGLGSGGAAAGSGDVRERELSASQFVARVKKGPTAKADRAAAPSVLRTDGDGGGRDH
jgi:hypothetical protein